LLKKKYVVEIVGIAAIVFLLGTLLNVNLLTVSGKEEEDDGHPIWQTYVTGVNASALPSLWQVNATNLAFDEQGNLRVILMDGDQNVTVTNLPVDENGNFKVKIVDDETPEKCNASAKIAVLDWKTRFARYRGEDVGIAVTGSYPADLAFIFQPYSSDFNVTEIYLVLYATNDADNFVLNINGAPGITESQLRLPVDYIQARRYQLNPNIVQINEGINLLSMSSSGLNWLSVYEIEIFIEYEYQAR